MKSKIYPFKSGEGKYPKKSQIIVNEVKDSHRIQIEFDVEKIIGHDPTEEDLNIDREKLLKILHRATNNIVEVHYSEFKPDGNVVGG